jgi:DNA processing protein
LGTNDIPLENDLLYQIALTRVTGIGPVHAKNLFRHFGEAGAVFRSGKEDLILTGLSATQAESILTFRDFDRLEKERLLLERKGIQPLFFTHKDYPQRLLSNNDAPALLFYKGNADLNAPKIVAIVGTRRPTEYGKQVTEKLVREISVALPGILIISGLAFGIDGAAHRAALNAGLPTIGVLGHGFSRIYPAEHTALARTMLEKGGLLTEFGYEIGPESYHFPLRNRIVAGMSDALIVVETALEGGSLMAAEKALKYRKEVFAIPGRIGDPKSAGCNGLIREGKARLLTGAPQLVTAMDWGDPGATDNPATSAKTTQTTLWTGGSSASGLSESENTLLQLLGRKESPSLDELAAESGLDNPSISMAILNLELRGLVVALPGKRYRPNF